MAVIGFVTGAETMNTGAKYFAMILFAVGVYGTNSIVLGWVSATLGQTKEKKACSLAIVNTIANVSFIWTPYLWPDSTEPRYRMGMYSSAAFGLATVAGAWVMRFWLMAINRKLPPTGDGKMMRFAY